MPAASTHMATHDMPKGAVEWLSSQGEAGRQILNHLVLLHHSHAALCEEVFRLRERIRLEASLKFGRKRESFFDVALAHGQIALAFFHLAAPAADGQPREHAQEQAQELSQIGGLAENLASGPVTTAGAQNPNDKPARRRNKRKKKPVDLSNVERRVVAVVRVEGPELNCPCCANKRRLAFVTESERLAIRPAEIVREVTQCEVWVCDECEGNFVRAPKPENQVGRAKVASSLRAALLISKLGFGIPTYRYLRMLEDSTGVVLSPATIDRWIANTLDSIAVLAKLEHARAIDCELISLDDSFGPSRIPPNQRKNQAGQLDPNGRTTENGRIWFLLGDICKAASVHYTSDWKASNLETLLAGFVGQIQGDGYAGFVRHCRNQLLNTPAGCMDHARRGFVNAMRAGNKQAGPIIQIFDQLYSSEDEATSRDLCAPEQRRIWRQRESVPIFERLSKMFHELHQSRYVRDLLSKATTYFIRQEQRLRVYLNDGRIPIGNTHVERMIRIYALMRQACKLFGSPAAARRYADGLTLMVNAILAGVSLFDYFNWVLEKIPRTRKEDLPSLLPHVYAAQIKIKAVASAA